jgi:UDP-N-acetylglucosamine transferase subunit ALG13
MATKVLFKVLSWGLGHATRSLPLIKQLIAERCDLTIASNGRCLELLRLEVGDQAGYIETQDMCTSFLRDFSWVFMIPKIPVELMRFMRSIRTENRLVGDLVKRYGFDIIISDSCYGAYDHRVPSYLLCHHLRPIWFWRAGFLQDMNEAVSWHVSKNFTKVLIPDYEHNSLTGSLSHDFAFFQRSKIEYIGILSDFVKLSVEEDIEYLVSISGSEPQRSTFIRQILSQLENFSGKTVVLLGEPESMGGSYKINEHVTVLPFVLREERDILMNRAKMIISRPGYSTIMDLIELGKKKVMFIPTRNHTEQEYLASYHGKTNNVYSVAQRKLDLERDVREAARRDAFCNVSDGGGTRGSVYRILDIVLNGRRAA